MIFGAVFNELTPQSAAALLSCFVFEERTGTARVTEEMTGYLRNLKVIYLRNLKVIFNVKIGFFACF